MPDYSYTAVSKDGRRQSATITAQNVAAAGHALREQGLLPMEIRELGQNKGIDILRSVSTISLAEKINFIENLGVMLKAGIAISRAMQIEIKQTKNMKMKNILTDVYNQVESGKSLADALEKHKNIFSNIVISMVKIGEMSGNLEKSLQYLSVQMHREADLKSKVKGAMIYPSVIVSAMIIIGVLMSIYVLPQLTGTFKEFGGELPVTTKVVIAVADFMSGHAAIVLGGMVGLVAAVIAFYKTATGKKAFHFMFLHILMIGKIVIKVNLARSSRILSSLLKSGIPIVQAMEVAGQSMDNYFYKKLLSDAAASVKVGTSISDSLGKNNFLFPILVVQMIQVGEESGTVEEILDQLATHYEEEVDNVLKNLSSVIEPLLLLVIGGVVGLLAIALIAPIYNLSQSIS